MNRRFLAFRLTPFDQRSTINDHQVSSRSIVDSSLVIFICKSNSIDNNSTSTLLQVRSRSLIEREVGVTLREKKEKKRKIIAMQLGEQRWKNDRRRNESKRDWRFNRVDRGFDPALGGEGAGSGRGWRAEEVEIDYSRILRFTCGWKSACRDRTAESYPETLHYPRQRDGTRVLEARGSQRSARFAAHDPT